MRAMSTLPAMTGDQFDPNLLSDDRDAIGAVQNAISKNVSGVKHS